MSKNNILRGAAFFGAAAVIGVAGVQVSSASPTVNAGASNATGSSLSQADNTSNIDSRRGARGKRGPRGFTGARGPRGFQGIQGIQGIQGQPGQPGQNGQNGLSRVYGAAAVALSANAAVSSTTGFIPFGAVTNNYAFARAAQPFTVSNFTVADGNIPGQKFVMATIATNNDGTPVLGNPTIITCEVAVVGNSCVAPGSLMVGAGNLWWFQPLTANFPANGTWSYTVS